MPPVRFHSAAENKSLLVQLYALLPLRSGGANVNSYSEAHLRRLTHRSKVKSITNLKVNLSGLGIVNSPEGGTVVEQESAVGEVEGDGSEIQVLSNLLAQGEIERRVTRQMSRDFG